MKVLTASIFTLGILGLMFFFIFAVTFGLFGGLSLLATVGLTAVLFFVFWLVGPWVSDLMYKWAYGLEWIQLEGLKQKDEGLAAFVEEVCAQEKIKLPKIGFINDDNPQAFTYGSDHWNARLVFTNGILKYLDGEERKAVFAHELGHVVHRDFIVMTIASFIVTVLYELYHALMRSSDNNKKGSGSLFIIAIIAYVFYVIGSYLVLFLSRTREYWADEFAKQKTSANALSSALIKIAFGILAAPDGVKTSHLMQSTRSLGIFDFKAAKSFGLVAGDKSVSGNWNAAEMAVVYDLNSLWAFWAEISSTHPLTGKRIMKLLEGDARPLLNTKRIETYPVDKGRLFNEFVRDWMITKAAFALGVIGLVWGLFSLTFFGAVGLGLLFFGVGTLIQAFYRYPSGPFTTSTVEELMSDLYASPVRGRPVSLKGEVVGKGVPGFVLSEDVMLEDKTGLLYLDYQSIIPVLGDWWFALTRVKSFVGQQCSAQGWFMRGMGQYLVLDFLESGGQKVSSRQKTLALIVGAVEVVLGIGLLFLLK